MDKIIHKFVSVAFQENFVPSQLPSDWQQIGNIVTDSKDTRAKYTLGCGVVYAYPFGALTFVDVEPTERAYEINELRSRLGLKMDAKVITEEFVVEEDPEAKPHVEHSKIVIDSLNYERRAVIAQVVAQSAAMEFYETITSVTKAQVNIMIESLNEKGKIGISPKSLYRSIGYSLSVRNEVIGMLHLLDKPDLIWDDFLMDKLYDDLRAAFDLGDRFKALEYKLNVIRESLEILAETVKDSRIFQLDVMIVLLIVIEVLFSLFTRFHWLGW